MNIEQELSKKQITKKKVFHKSLTDVDTPYMSQEPTQPSLPSSLQWENRGAVHPPVAAESAGLVIFHQNGTGGTAGGMGSADHDQPIEEEQARPNPIPGPGIQDKVVEATTPLSSLSYKEQVGKKQRETRLVAQQMQAEVLAASPESRAWVEMQVGRFGHLARLDNVKESPVLEGYSNKCEFAVGINPETTRLTGKNDLKITSCLLKVKNNFQTFYQLGSSWTRGPGRQMSAR